MLHYSPNKKSYYWLLTLVITLWSVRIASANTDWKNGSAFITSQIGTLSYRNFDGAKISIQQHDIIEIGGATINTEKDSQLYLALTNGLAIGIGPQSEAQCITYKQQPYKVERQGTKYEPSTSILKIAFQSGTIALSCPHLSPLTEMRLILPIGELRLHRGTCVIQCTPSATNITAYDGMLTFYYPNGSEREFIAEPMSVRITPQSAKLGRIAEDETDEILEDNLLKLAQATEYAKNRVLFRVSNRGDVPQLPQPTLVVPNSYYQQPSARPYEFVKD